jgi:hypothetical protein
MPPFLQGILADLQWVNFYPQLTAVNVKKKADIANRQGQDGCDLRATVTITQEEIVQDPVFDRCMPYAFWQLGVQDHGL